MGNRIRQERAAISVTQNELAKITGVTRKTVQKWENGQARIPSDKLNTLCDFFACTADWLLGRSEVRKVSA